MSECNTKMSVYSLFLSHESYLDVQIRLRPLELMSKSDVTIRCLKVEGHGGLGSLNVRNARTVTHRIAL